MIWSGSNNNGSNFINVGCDRGKHQSNILIMSKTDLITEQQLQWTRLKKKKT